MKRPRAYRQNLGSTVPEELLFAAIRWEALREGYFTSLCNEDKAFQARELKHLYSKRLWEECGIQSTI